jgi:hypothetical protein
MVAGSAGRRPSHKGVIAVACGVTVVMMAPLWSEARRDPNGRPAFGMASASGAQTAPGLDEARHVFRKEPFGGNGRTCETCHSPGTGRSASTTP